jgi:Ca-activated chloride channel family protein
MLTAIGDALATACARLEKVEMKSRIVVLLSDGESNFGLIKPLDAVKAAKKLGIRIYAIGVGSTGLAPVKVIDQFGREVIAQAQFSLDENLLRQVADVTGGRYYYVRDPKALKQALGEIDKLEKTRVSSEVFTRADERFARFLAPGLLLLALGAFFRNGSGRELV